MVDDVRVKETSVRGKGRVGFGIGGVGGVVGRMGMDIEIEQESLGTSSSSSSSSSSSRSSSLNAPIFNTSTSSSFSNASVNNLKAFAEKKKPKSSQPTEYKQKEKRNLYSQDDSGLQRWSWGGGVVLVRY